MNRTMPHENVASPSRSNVNGNVPAGEIFSVPGGRPDILNEPETVTLASSLSRNPHKLCDLIIQQAKQPPPYYLRINGSHIENKKHVVDFNFSLDLTPTLVWQGPDNCEKGWRDLRVVNDGDGQKAYRGGRCMSRYSPKSASLHVDPVELNSVVDDGGGFNETEEGFALLSRTQHGSDADNSVRSLMKWCERFCRNNASIKS